MNQIRRVGYTQCRDAITVSTVGHPKRILADLDYLAKSVPISLDWRPLESLDRYQNLPAAFASHRRLVPEHGGASLLGRLLS